MYIFLNKVQSQTITLRIRYTILASMHHQYDHQAFFTKCHLRIEMKGFKELLAQIYSFKEFGANFPSKIKLIKNISMKFERFASYTNSHKKETTHTYMSSLRNAPRGVSG